MQGVRVLMKHNAADRLFTKPSNMKCTSPIHTASPLQATSAVQAVSPFYAGSSFRYVATIGKLPSIDT